MARKNDLSTWITDHPRHLKRLVLTLLCIWGPWSVRVVQGDALVAVFAEPDFPYYNASGWLSPDFVCYVLRSVGVECELVNAAQLANPEVFNPARFKVLAYVYGNTFPVAAFDNLRRFHHNRGCIVAFGGVPFCHPCVCENGKWVDKIDEMGWEFVSHQKMGTGLWADAADVDALKFASRDPLGLAWMRLPLPPKGTIQFPRMNMTIQDSGALGFDHFLGIPPEDKLVPVVSALKDGRSVGHPVCIIEHYCPQFAGAIDVWAGATLSPLLTMQQQEQLILATCAYVLERTGALSPAGRARILAAARARFVARVTERPPPDGPFVPRGAPPAKRLMVLDITAMNPDEKLLAVTLQGIVNRRKPRVYFITHFKDTKWLRLLRDEGCAPRDCQGVDELLQMFRGELAGAIVYDPAQPHTVNPATTLASVKNAVVAAPDLAARYRLQVVEDLRGRFNSPVEAYEWAIRSLWPRLQHRAVACLPPRSVAPRDYIVQFGLFTFWLDGQAGKHVPPDQLLFFERLMARMPPHGSVHGWWQEGEGGVGEVRGVTVSSQYAKITVCTADTYNLSVHCGTRMPAALSQKVIRFGSLEKKVYIAFIVSDGDNFGMNLYAVIGRLWEQRMRGKVPLGWGICPTQVELTPDVVRYFYESATPNDLFVCMDGLGYIYPDHYGSALGNAPDYYGDFLRKTWPYMRQLDQRHLWFLGGTSRAGQMAEVLSLDGLFGEYSVSPERRQSLFGETAALWSDVNPWAEGYREVKTYTGAIRSRTPKERPAFLFAGVNGFCIGPNQVAQILKELGPDYVAVRPDELCFLYRRFKTTGLDANPVPRPPLDLLLPEPPAPSVNDQGALVVREDDGDPEISDWFTDPQGTQWVRKRLHVPLPEAATKAVVHTLVRGEKGARVTLRVNGHEHALRLPSSAWQWVTVEIPASEVREGQNEVWYTGNPDGRLMIAGDASIDLGHSDFGGPVSWSNLAGELMCYLEVR